MHPIRTVKNLLIHIRAALDSFIATTTTHTKALIEHSAALAELQKSIRCIEESLRYLAASDRHQRQQAGQRTDL